MGKIRNAKTSKVFNTELTEFDLSENQLKALKGYVSSFGNVSAGCREAGIERTTWYSWRDPSFKLALESAKEEVIRRKAIQDNDRVEEIEESLYNSAKSGKENSMMFFLKNRSPDRWRNDYIQGQVYIQNTKNTLNYIQTAVGELSNKELLAEAKALTQRIQELGGKDAKEEIVIEGGVRPGEADGDREDSGLGGKG